MKETGDGCGFGRVLEQRVVAMENCVNDIKEVLEGMRTDISTTTKWVVVLLVILIMLLAGDKMLVLAGLMK